PVVSPPSATTTPLTRTGSARPSASPTHSPPTAKPVDNQDQTTANSTPPWLGKTPIETESEAIRPRRRFLKLDNWFEWFCRKCGCMEVANIPDDVTHKCTRCDSPMKRGCKAIVEQAMPCPTLQSGAAC